MSCVREADSKGFANNFSIFEVLLVEKIEILLIDATINVRVKVTVQTAVHAHFQAFGVKLTWNVEKSSKSNIKFVFKNIEISMTLA